MISFDNSKTTRRTFLDGMFSLGFLSASGCVLRAPTGLLSGAGANLTLGVISDIHVDVGRGDFKKFGDTASFEHALRWFDEQGVDGVVLAGDMADNGMVNQLECVGAAWFRVFPDGRSTRDGRPVEQLFVYGNHDIEGQNYDKFGDRFSERKSFEAQWICRDRAKAWRDVFHEEYAPIWMKTVKGYQFVGAHWVNWGGVPGVETWFKDNAAKIDRTKPFFYIQHPHPGGTVYGSDAWRPDKGYATRALSAFPNAVALSGHSHDSLTDERSIWQGAFTSVGTASLRYGGAVDQWEQRQGLLLKVYDDRLVFVRRDFLHDQSLGDDWVVPLSFGTKEAKPFSFRVRRATSCPPQFAADAKLAVTREKNGWLVTIPPASAAATRSFRFEIATGLQNAKGKPIVFHAWDAKYNMPRTMSGAPTKFLVKANALPTGEDGQPLAPKIVVTPLDSFGNRGRPLQS